MLKRLVEMSPDDDRQVAVWRKVQEWAPTVWNASKPVLQSIIGAGLRKLLGL